MEKTLLGRLSRPSTPLAPAPLRSTSSDLTVESRFRDDLFFRCSDAVAVIMKSAADAYALEHKMLIQTIGSRKVLW